MEEKPIKIGKFPFYFHLDKKTKLRGKGFLKVEVSSDEMLLYGEDKYLDEVERRAIQTLAKQTDKDILNR